MPYAEDSVMLDVSKSHKRHHEYTYRLPTPPRIVVPPPTLTTEMPDLLVGVGDSPDQEWDTSFLKEWNLDSIVQKNTLLDWSYERRRQAQLILPWLYLGPLTSAKDKEFLAREGITMILAIRARDNSMNGVLQSARDVCHEVATIEAANNFMLTSHFPRATKLINRHIAKVRQLTASTPEPRLGKVLVFCESGNEKSAAVAAAYLMEMLDDFDHIKAMQVCQAQRFCVNFDDGIKNILRAYWDILQAKRAVAMSRSDSVHTARPINNLGQDSLHVQTPPASKQKRRIEDTSYDDDMDMSDGVEPSDMLRFLGRDNTPFRDS
jgi:serine/threonine/tyrosine-interacting protein